MNSSTEIEKERHEAVEQSDWNTAYGENNVYLQRVKYCDIVPRGIMQGGVFTVMASIVASLFLDSPTGENFYDLWTLPSSGILELVWQATTNPLVANAFMVGVTMTIMSIMVSFTLGEHGISLRYWPLISFGLLIAAGFAITALTDHFNGTYIWDWRQFLMG